MRCLPMADATRSSMQFFAERIRIMRETFAGAFLLTTSLLFTASAAAQMVCGDPSDVDTCDESKCAVLVYKDTAGAWKISPYNLFVTKQNAKIMFLQLQGGGKFVGDPSKANGLELRASGAGQFDPSQQYPTDKYSSNPPKQAEGPIWHLKFKNQGAQRKDIKYVLRFQDAANQTVTCDPLINNSGPILKSKPKPKKP
jgi:hypothetical protein